MSIALQILLLILHINTSMSGNFGRLSTQTLDVKTGFAIVVLQGLK